MTKQDVINGIVRAIRQAEADDVGNGLPNWAEIRADRIRQWDIALGLVRDIDDVQPQPQQEPSVLEVALQIYITHSISLNLQWRQCIDLAFEMIEEFRAEDARRAGK